MGFQRALRLSPVLSHIKAYSQLKMAPRPIVVCGRNPSIAKAVRKHLLPEYDAIHICLTPESANIDIPLLLQGQAPPNHTDNLGSQIYTQAPIAIAIGGGYNDENVESMKKACEGVEGLKKVPWLRPDDATNPRTGLQKLVSGAPLQDSDIESFGESTAKRVKECLGKEDVKGDGFYLY